MITKDDLLKRWWALPHRAAVSAEDVETVVDGLFPAIEDAFIAASMPSEITRQKLVPFRSRGECPKCAAVLVLMTPGWLKLKLMHWRGQVYSGYNIAHCAGGRPPEDTRDVLTPFGKQEIRQTFPCAGVTEDHLHIVCQRCGFHLLMQVAGR